MIIEIQSSTGTTVTMRRSFHSPLAALMVLTDRPLWIGPNTYVIQKFQYSNPVAVCALGSLSK